MFVTANGQRGTPPQTPSPTPSLLKLTNAPINTTGKQAGRTPPPTAPSPAATPAPTYAPIATPAPLTPVLWEHRPSPTAASTVGVSSSSTDTNVQDSVATAIIITVTTYVLAFMGVVAIVFASLGMSRRRQRVTTVARCGASDFGSPVVPASSLGGASSFGLGAGADGVLHGIFPPLSDSGSLRPAGGDWFGKADAPPGALPTEGTKAGKSVGGVSGEVAGTLEKSASTPLGGHGSAPEERLYRHFVHISSSSISVRTSPDGLEMAPPLVRGGAGVSTFGIGSTVDAEGSSIDASLPSGSKSARPSIGSNVSQGTGVVNGLPPSSISLAAGPVFGALQAEVVPENALHFSTSSGVRPRPASNELNVMASPPSLGGVHARHVLHPAALSPGSIGSAGVRMPFPPLSVSSSVMTGRSSGFRRMNSPSETPLSRRLGRSNSFNAAIEHGPGCRALSPSQVSSGGSSSTRPAAAALRRYASSPDVHLAGNPFFVTRHQQQLSIRIATHGSSYARRSAGIRGTRYPAGGGSRRPRRGASSRLSIISGDASSTGPSLLSIGEERLPSPATLAAAAAATNSRDDNVVYTRPVVGGQGQVYPTGGDAPDPGGAVRSFVVPNRRRVGMLSPGISISSAGGSTIGPSLFGTGQGGARSPATLAATAAAGAADSTKGGDDGPRYAKPAAGAQDESNPTGGAVLGRAVRSFVVPERLQDGRHVRNVSISSAGGSTIGPSLLGIEQGGPLSPATLAAAAAATAREVDDASNSTSSGVERARCTTGGDDAPVQHGTVRSFVVVDRGREGRFSPRISISSAGGSTIEHSMLASSQGGAFSPATIAATAAAAARHKNATPAILSGFNGASYQANEHAPVVQDTIRSFVVPEQRIEGRTHRSSISISSAGGSTIGASSLGVESEGAPSPATRAAGASSRYRREDCTTYLGHVANAKARGSSYPSAGVSSFVVTGQLRQQGLSPLLSNNSSRDDGIARSFSAVGSAREFPSTMDWVAEVPDPTPTPESATAPVAATVAAVPIATAVASDPVLTTGNKWFPRAVVSTPRAAAHLSGSTISRRDNKVYGSHSNSSSVSSSLDGFHLSELYGSDVDDGAVAGKGELDSDQEKDEGKVFKNPMQSSNGDMV